MMAGPSNPKDRKGVKVCDTTECVGAERGANVSHHYLDFRWEEWIAFA